MERIGAAEAPRSRQTRIDHRRSSFFPLICLVSTHTRARKKVYPLSSYCLLRIYYPFCIVPCLCFGSVSIKTRLKLTDASKLICRNILLNQQVQLLA